MGHTDKVIPPAAQASSVFFNSISIHLCSFFWEEGVGGGVPFVIRNPEQTETERSVFNTGSLAASGELSENVVPYS